MGTTTTSGVDRPLARYAIEHPALYALAASTVVVPAASLLLGGIIYGLVVGVGTFVVVFVLWRPHGPMRRLCERQEWVLLAPALHRGAYRESLGGDRRVGLEAGIFEEAGFFTRAYARVYTFASHGKSGSRPTHS